MTVCRNPSCKVGEIVQGQYGAEGDGPFAERLASGYCSKRCRRLYPPSPPSRVSSLEGGGFNHQRPELRAVVKERTRRDESFREFTRTFDCCECGWPSHMGFIENHHIRTGGMAIKGDDYESVPLCGVNARGCHAKADKSPESYQKYLPVALMLQTLWVKAGHTLKNG